MAHITPFRLGVLFAGCVLGAGFVSGQELFQFFTAYGKIGFWGFLLSVLLFFAVGVLILRTAKIGNITEMDGIVVSGKHKTVCLLIGILESAMLFSVYIIMVAGVGSLAEQLLSIPSPVATAVFCLLSALLAAGGIPSLSKFFSLCVPILILFALAVALGGIFTFGENGFFLENVNEPNLFFPHFSVSALLYVAYNVFGSLGVLVPVAAHIQKKKTVYLGMLFGVVMLGVVGGVILLALAAFPASLSTPMPMLTLAMSLGKTVGVLYGILLVLAMLGAALSCLGGLCVYFKQKLPCRNGLLHALPLGAVAFLLSFLGFGNLISVLYPFFGYFGVLILIAIFIHYLRLCQAQKKRK